MNGLNRLEQCRRDYIRRQRQRSRERAYLLRGLFYFALGASVAFGLSNVMGWGWGWPICIGSACASVLIAAQD